MKALRRRKPEPLTYSDLVIISRALEDRARWFLGEAAGLAAERTLARVRAHTEHVRRSGGDLKVSR